MDNLKLVYIEWRDVASDNENIWKDETNTSLFFEREDNLVKETGFVWSEDDDNLYLVVRYMPGDCILSAGRTIIPKAWIKNRQELKIKLAQ